MKNLEYVPLIPVMQKLYRLPRNMARFRTYLRTIFPNDESRDQLLPLLAMNPMAKDHVMHLLDALLAIDADGIGARATAEAAAELSDIPGDFKVGIVIADDWLGGWTNRYADEFTFRFCHDHIRARPDSNKRPRWLKDYWITGVLWSSDPASEAAVRQAVKTAIYRTAYRHQHGLAKCLREMLAQEGSVMSRAGCTGPVLDADDLDYTREVLAPCLDSQDTRTCMECVFGDAAGQTLGFTPRGLSPWAGLALALNDAKNSSSSPRAFPD